MIKFSVARLEKEPIELTGSEPAEFLEIEPGELLAVSAPVEYDLNLKAVSGGALVEGQVSTELSGICGRCLEPVTRHVKNDGICLFLELGDQDEMDISEEIRAEMLLELSDELERNLYIEAIVKEYGRYGVGTEDIRKRVNTLALKGTPAEKRIQPKSGTPETKKKESAADKAQKLMLTWLVNYPGIFEQVEKYISPSDFVVPLYKEVAQMLFDQHKEGETNPGKLLNAFTDSEEQREVASLFNATIHLENEGEQQRAFSDTLLRIKEESLKEKNRTWDPSDMAGLQELIKAKKELEDLGRKRQQLHISFN